MFHEVESGTDTWQPHNDVRLFARVEAALNAALPIPGRPPSTAMATEWEFISSRPLSSDVELLAYFERMLDAVYSSFSVERPAGLRGAIGSSADPPHVTPVTPWTDNVAKELTDLARAGDAPSFRCLAACVMPVEEIDECWAGARGRLGLNDADP